VPGGAQPGDGEVAGVVQQFCFGVEGLLGRGRPEFQLVSFVAAGEAVPDVTTVIGSEAPSASGLPRGGQAGAEYADAAEVISAALHWFK